MVETARKAVETAQASIFRYVHPDMMQKVVELATRIGNVISLKSVRDIFDNETGSALHGAGQIQERTMGVRQQVRSIEPMQTVVEKEADTPRKQLCRALFEEWRSLNMENRGRNAVAEGRAKPRERA